MDIRYRDGTTDTIRLLGIDTPEVHVENDPAEFEGIPETQAGRDWLRDWGHKASEFARTEIAGQEVRLVVDETADRRGSYGRLLVYVYYDGELFNRQLLDQGYARLYDTTFSKRSQFATAEQQAQDGRAGLWDFEAPDTPTPTPTETSGSDGTLSVAQIHADAEGNDHENENDEYVVFANTGDSALDLTGYTVVDEADHEYRFPDGFTLDPGAEVTLYTGSGTDSASALYWGSDSAIWNNGGDTVYVRDAAGDVVLAESY